MGTFHTDPEREQELVVKMTMGVFGRADHVHKAVDRMKREMELAFGAEVEVELLSEHDVDGDQLTLPLE